MSELTTMPNWDEIKAIANELDQMGAQTVLRGCDVGDMLRKVRATMDRESFLWHCNKKLNREELWANQMITLSFRRPELLKALAEGHANDSIRSAYAAVKSIPKLEEEKMERKQWPKAKRGPSKGSKGAGRPKKKKAVKWESIAQESGLLPKGATPAQKKEAVEKIIEVTGGTMPEDTESLEKVCVEAVVRESPSVVAAQAQAEGDELKADLSMTSVERLDATIRAYKRKLEAEAEIAMQDRVRDELQKMLDMYNAESEKHRRVIAGYKGALTKGEYKSLVSVFHTDKLISVLDDVTKKKFEKAFHILQDKKLELVGDEGNGEQTSLPTTVDELRAMRMKRKFK